MPRLSGCESCFCAFCTRVSDSKILADVLEYKFPFEQTKMCHEVHPFVKQDNEQAFLTLLNLPNFPPGRYFVYVLCPETEPKVKG